MADETPTPTPTPAPPPLQSPPAPPPPQPPSDFVSVTETQTPHPPEQTEQEQEKEQEKEKEKEKEKEVIVEPEKEKPNPVDEQQQKKVPQSLVSFKEESNKVSDLLDAQKRALDELRNLVKEGIEKNEFVGTEAEVSSSSKGEEVSIWGVSLLKEGPDQDKSDVILIKFLRARDFKPKDAFTMLKNTIKWRKQFGIDALIDEDLGDDLEKVVFMHGSGKDGNPVCYNVYGEFQNKELYQKTFANEEKRTKFLRWRIQFLERSIRKLDFSPGGVCTIFQVSDLKNSPGPGKGELRLATKQALQLLQDNYPEFVAKQVFINVPWWYLAFYTMISPFLTQRTKSKFVFASPARTAEILFKYIAPEQVPIQYGGLSVDFCECNPDFTMDDPVTEITVKPSSKQTVEILVHEECTVVWELRVVGWGVSYTAEYTPNDENGYSIILHKTKKMTPTDEPVLSNSFKVRELGKIVLTIDNPTSKKKKLLYRLKVQPL